MATPCLACTVEVPAGARFCPGCGATVDLASTPTGTAPRGEPRRPSPAPAPGSGSRGTSAARVSSVVAADARFVPGAVLRERYRIVGLLGKGGMGEVYRADDLKLGQAVALKFLPESLAGDTERRERFYNEVRTAREVTHPAVTRVHDIDEVDGHVFLSMEYVDGEDLGSLLRRIGHLPQDKAVEIARQVCAGLAAAHDKGVLHRDLKPENVMLDGRGCARITDFGLAGLAHTITGGDVRSGTPAYMSPEQLAGREVTAKSDIYALGLVLYELFTGKRAFSGRTWAELTRQHREEQPASPSTVVDGLDPAIESVILRCLEKDPADRPPSALAVAAALPGGDPLAAALAAGETPSPEMVAALAPAEGLSVRAGLACLGVVLLALVLAPLMGPRLHLLGFVPFEKSPAALEDRARELVRKLGYTDRPLDRDLGLGVEVEYIEWIRRNDKGHDRWKKLGFGRPAAVLVWYRQSPRSLLSPHQTGRVYSMQPPPLVSGMSGVKLDTQGRLYEFYAVPPQRLNDAGAAAAAAPREPDWAVLFAEAGLDMAAFRRTEPRWNPLTYADTRAAWEGAFPERPEVPLRVEAAGYAGRPVMFQLVAPWTRAERMQAFPYSRGMVIANRVGTFIIVLIGLSACLLARRHVRLGRGDRRGAARLASWAFLLSLAAWLLQADHVADVQGELGLIVRGVAWNLLIGGFIWVLYLALEPFVRRRWPRTIVSWTRLLAGRWRDPLVGRDLLLGTAAGALMTVFILVAEQVPPYVGQPPAMPWYFVSLDPVLGLREVLAAVLSRPVGSVAVAMGFVLLLLLARRLLRLECLAALAVMALLSVQAVFFTEAAWWLIWPMALVMRAIPVLTTLKVGLLATVACLFVVTMLVELPMVPDLFGWAGGMTVASLLVVSALALFAYRTATAGRSLGFTFGD